MRSLYRLTSFFKPSTLCGVLPLLAVVMYETHVRFSAIKTFGTDHPLLSMLIDSNLLYQNRFTQPEHVMPLLAFYLTIFAWIMMQSLPLFASWIVTQQGDTKRTEPERSTLNKLIPLSIGFGVYPVGIYILESLFPHLSAYNFFSGHFYILALAALITALTSLKLMSPTVDSSNLTQAQVKIENSTLLSSLYRFFINGLTNVISKLISNLTSLNGIVFCILFCWAFVLAGAFHYHDDPLHNMPLNLIIDLKQIITDPLPFLSYFWQFAIMASTIWMFYAFNRTILIGYVLSRVGVFNFLLSGFIFWVMFTPIAATIIVSLPINPVDFSFLPSENFNIFDADNYKISFLILLFTTPLILAFERQQEITKTAQITEQKTQTELQLLQQQINPHFLFNSLNSLYAFALKKSDETPALVLHLSDMLRYTVYEGQKQSVGLDKEIEYLTNYINLQKTRLGQRITIEWKYPTGDLTAYSIVPLLLILIVENAFKHGAETHHGEGFVELNITINNDLLKFTCLNTLPDDFITPSQSTSFSGLGLNNLSRRLALQYKNRYQYKAGYVSDYNHNDKSQNSEAKRAIWQTTLELKLS